MELIIKRTYFPHGTNGMLFLHGRLLCYTIELPWLNNAKGLSCIPEGTYRLTRRYSPRFKDHLLVNGVTGREFILLHPANDAGAELRGCIAPVSKLTGEGKGTESRKACKLVFQRVHALLEEGPVLLTIQSKTNDDSTKAHRANTPFL